MLGATYSGNAEKAGDVVRKPNTDSACYVTSTRHLFVYRLDNDAFVKSKNALETIRTREVIT